MFKLKILVCFIILILFSSCSKEVSKETLIKEKSLELQVEEAYKEGIEAEGGIGRSHTERKRQSHCESMNQSQCHCLLYLSLSPIYIATFNSSNT